VLTFVLLKAMSFVMDLRATPKEEGRGMDIANHGEEAYSDGEGAILLLDDEIMPAPVPSGDGRLAQPAMV
jgi:Amt family ammonium transporter